MGRCETCKAWGRDGERDGERAICHKMSSDAGWKEYGDGGSLANAVGDYNEGARVFTLPTFGCVMHEQREANTP